MSMNTNTITCMLFTFQQKHLDVHVKTMTIHYDFSSKEEVTLAKGGNRYSSQEDPILLRPFSNAARVGCQGLEEEVEDWIRALPKAAVFRGREDTFLGKIFIVVYKSRYGKICTSSFTKFGIFFFDDLLLDSRSRFWSSCENLSPENRDSKVRRALAITCLKIFNQLFKNNGLSVGIKADETTAGDIANKMDLVHEITPQEIGHRLLDLGLIQSSALTSFVADVIYDDVTNGSPDVANSMDTAILKFIGKKLDLRCDLFSIYSPDVIESTYEVPKEYNGTFLFRRTLVDLIVQELITVQSNSSSTLTRLLEKLILPLRSYLRCLNSGDVSPIVNTVFPPTIDEISRVSSILNDAIKKASNFGYREIFKALATLLPYYYEASVRHEASLKEFAPTLRTFFDLSYKRFLYDPKLNPESFTINEIDSTIIGSLLELLRLKLIIERLWKKIMEEKIDSKCDIEGDLDLQETKSFFMQAVEIINAFGINPPGLGQRGRTFTPSGKMLTEVATNWPFELYYGWLTRRIVGIFELKNITSYKDNHFFEILVVFSDLVLFLKIIEESFYQKCEKHQETLSPSHMLLHSLVNRIPIGSSTLPKMEVSCYAPVDDIGATTYCSKSIDTFEPKEYVRLITKKKEGFYTNCAYPVYCAHYEVLTPQEPRRKKVQALQIIELINKAKLLSKHGWTQILHSETPNFSLLSGLQGVSTYAEESSKSPIVLGLGLGSDRMKEFLTFPEVTAVMNIDFNQDKGDLHLSAYTKDREHREPFLEKNISSHDLTQYIKQIIQHVFISNFEDGRFRSIQKAYERDIFPRVCSFLGGYDDNARSTKVRFDVSEHQTLCEGLSKADKSPTKKKDLNKSLMNKNGKVLNKLARHFRKYHETDNKASNQKKNMEANPVFVGNHVDDQSVSHYFQHDDKTAAIGSYSTPSDFNVSEEAEESVANGDQSITMVKEDEGTYGEFWDSVLGSSDEKKLSSITAALSPFPRDDGQQEIDSNWVSLNESKASDFFIKKIRRNDMAIAKMHGPGAPLTNGCSYPSEESELESMHTALSKLQDTKSLGTHEDISPSTHSLVSMNTVAGGEKVVAPSPDSSILQSSSEEHINFFLEKVGLDSTRSFESNRSSHRYRKLSLTNSFKDINGLRFNEGPYYEKSNSSASSLTVIEDEVTENI